MRKGLEKKCEVALTLTKALREQTRKLMELGILQVMELIGQEYEEELRQGGPSCDEKWIKDRIIRKSFSGMAGLIP